MIFQRTRLTWLPLALGLLPAASVAGQDFPDAQRLTNKVLFAREDAAQQRRLAEQARVDELDARARRQDVLLEQQAASVQQLGSEVRQIRDERRLIDLAAAFDAAIAGGRWTQARPLLADSVSVQLAGDAMPASFSADALVARLIAAGVQGGVQPRANQRVRFEGERATLLSDGFAWERPARGAGSREAGSFEYGFVRVADGWRIDGIVFHGAGGPR